MPRHVSRTDKPARRVLPDVAVVREPCLNLFQRHACRPGNGLEIHTHELPVSVPLDALKVRVEKPVVFQRRVKGAPSSYTQTSRGRSARRVTGNGLAKPTALSVLTNVGVTGIGRANFGCGCGGTGCASRRRASCCSAGCSRRCPRPANAGHGAGRSGRVAEELKLTGPLTVGERVEGSRIPNPTDATGSSRGKTGAGVQNTPTVIVATAKQAEQRTQADNGLQG